MSDELESRREQLLKAYDEAFGEVVETLCTLPSDLRRLAIVDACNDDDWKSLAEMVAYAMSEDGTKSASVYIWLSQTKKLTLSATVEPWSEEELART